MNMSQFLHFQRWKKRRIPLRLRLALWFGGLVLISNFALLLFINTAALSAFPGIIGQTNSPPLKHESTTKLPTVPPSPVGEPFNWQPLNPLAGALLFELQSISLIGLGLVAILSGATAYGLAGITLRPVGKISQAAQEIRASTLHTRLAMDGPKDEIKELADTFDTMLGRLERTFELQSRFIGDIAHELRTPLASLRTNLEVVTSDAEATLEDYRLMAATQERALTRLERLVADLLILAKNEQPLLRSEVSLGPLVEEVLTDLKYAASARKVTLRLINKTEVVIQGDATLLARAFSNLVENAINYNRPGGEVTITIDHKDSWAVVTIADTGIGIEPEKQEHIFDRFYRIDSSRSRHNGGAGLGLSIVTAIVQQHGGWVQVESTPNVGSVFTMLLPL